MRKILLMVLVAQMAAIFLFSVGMAAAEEAPRMAPDELKDRLGSPDLVLIDVRQPSDWERSSMKIEGAWREDPRLTESWADRYSREKMIVLYCQ